MSGQPVIEVFELAGEIRQSPSSLVILDCRYDLSNIEAGEEAFFEGHIPGAHYASLHRDLSGPLGRYGGRHPLPDTTQFQQFARAAGISDRTQVVVYDDQRLAFAARAWWLLRYFGHPQVAVLNGGLSAWRAAGLPLEAGSTSASTKAGNIVCAAQGDALRHYNEIYKNLDAPPWQVIDARDPARFAGTEEPIDPIAGHIPSAINKPWQSITDEGGMLKSRKELTAHWRDIPTGKELVCYCGSGVTACVNLLSLHLIGRDNTRLYPGSWSDWCANALTSEK